MAVYSSLFRLRFGWYGESGLVDACSGDELAEGYSYVDGDCDDSNSDINPESIEIAYDYIDNDCNGFDLADVDLDGFCKEGYAIQDSFLQCPCDTNIQGSDCDDYENAINPK